MQLEALLNAPVAFTLFAITLITSLMAFQNEELKERFLLRPYDTIHRKEYYRLFTSGLVHANTMHLVFNMLTFYFFAFSLETHPYDPARSLGHWQFAVLYVLTLLMSDTITLAKHHQNRGFGSLGASGAISGVVLAAILCNPEMELGLIFIPGLYIPGWLFALLYIGYSYYYSRRDSSLNINHDAHLLGAVLGIVFTLILKPEVISFWVSYLS
jgi:membrane associated rhomboid family serine protease